MFQDRYAGRPGGAYTPLRHISRPWDDWVADTGDGVQLATFALCRRFGEQVNDMSQEDKLLARLVKARTNQARKKSVFNLNDEEGDTGTVLTHFGRALGGLAAGEGVDMGGDDYDGARVSPACRVRTDVCSHGVCWLWRR